MLKPLHWESGGSAVYYKRLKEDTFDGFSRTLIAFSEELQSASGGIDTPKGKLKIDTTIADQHIRYPTDLSLVNEARLKTEVMIDLLWELLNDQLAVKPRTYRKVAHKRYLSQSKKKKASKASLRKTLRYLLNCVERNLGHIYQMLDMVGGRAFPLPHKYQRQLLWVIHTLYAQQRGMYDADSRRCDDRIVSISQPHVRPILRGKTGKRVEFGAKLGLSLFGGYLTHQTLSWDAYNEASDLENQAETYRLLTGHYPELIQCDKIYHTNDNRSWCTERDIRMTTLPKGPKLKTQNSGHPKSGFEPPCLY